MTYDPQPTPRPVVVAATGFASSTKEGTVDCPINVSLIYDPADPFAVAIDLANPDGHEYEEDGRYARWHVSREVLDTCCTWGTPSGACDFRAFPARDDKVTLRFMESVVRGRSTRHTGDYLDVAVPRERLVHFLTLSKNAVPVGRESRYLDIDAVLAELLAR